MWTTSDYCDKCGVQFHYCVNLTEHMPSCSYYCVFCVKISPKDGNLTRHISEKHHALLVTISSNKIAYSTSFCGSIIISIIIITIIATLIVITTITYGHNHHLFHHCLGCVCLILKNDNGFLMALISDLISISFIRDRDLPRTMEAVSRC